MNLKVNMFKYSLITLSNFLYVFSGIEDHLFGRLQSQKFESPILPSLHLTYPVIFQEILISFLSDPHIDLFFSYSSSLPQFSSSFSLLMCYNSPLTKLITQFCPQPFNPSILHTSVQVVLLKCKSSQIFILLKILSHDGHSQIQIP